MDKIYLIEDHHQALKIWRQKQIQGLDLVHIDAHIDFACHQAWPIDRVIKEARSLKELKNRLEHSIAFKRYEADFDKQTNIGNYIYPAMQEGLVNDFYWVIPGGLKEFNQSWGPIKNIIRGLSRSRSEKLKINKGDGLVSFTFLGREFSICVLEKLPILRHKVLLDIDTDFLIVGSLLKAANTVEIGKRNPWITPLDLVNRVKKKIEQPKIITIAYSVNGGYTPIDYKILGDEIAYYFSSQQFERSYRQKLKAALFFKNFKSSRSKVDYNKAVEFNPSYRVADNNYGPLYLAAGKIKRAENEFSKIARVDPKNPYALSGLGEICLWRQDFKRAKFLFSRALRLERYLVSARLGLAKAEFKLANFKKAKVLFLQNMKLKPMDAQVYYFLGRIYENERHFEKSAKHYRDAMRLGLNDFEIISRLLRIVIFSDSKYDIIKSVDKSLKGLKDSFLKQRDLGCNKNGVNKKHLRLKRRILFLELKIKKERGNIDERR